MNIEKKLKIKNRKFNKMVMPQSSRSVEKNSVAFTLAEVLITLGIIGVVAAMTIPTVINNYKVKQTVTTIKKIYSIISNAVLRAQTEHDIPYEWTKEHLNADNLTTDEKEANAEVRATIIANNIKPYLKILDDCGTKTCEHLHSGEVHMLRGPLHAINFQKNRFYKFQVADGTVFYINGNGQCKNTESNCSDIMFDINGKKEPNTLGRDIFYFGLYGNGKVVIPGVGSNPNDTSSTFACNPKREGWLCAGWFFYKENMDYLKCADELTWSGKNTCK